MRSWSTSEELNFAKEWSMIVKKHKVIFVVYGMSLKINNRTFAHSEK